MDFDMKGLAEDIVTLTNPHAIKIRDKVNDLFNGINPRKPISNKKAKLALKKKKEQRAQRRKSR